MDANGKRGRIEKYVKARLWNNRMRVNSEYISREELLKEIEKYYLKGRSLKDDPESKERLVTIIERTRKKVRKSWSDLMTREKEWSAMLGISRAHVHVLYVDGLIKNRSDVKKIKKVLYVAGLRR
ncbi:MAG TPA: hypothetical protein PLY11_14195 [Syntrophorhabdus sp.]|nr:hypothetical protein [Syntrophorhabdus sp.]